MLKKILLLTNIFIINLLFITVTEAKIEEYKESVIKTNNFNTIIESNSEILLLKENTIIEKYNLNYEFVSSKQFNNLNNSKIIKHNNKYILVGIKNNYLNFYIIDNNLKIENSFNINTIVSPKTNIMLINDNNNKTIIIPTLNNIPIDNKIYIIENDDITERKLKDYNDEELKVMLKKDYYLINEAVSITPSYNETSFDGNILIYYNNNSIKLTNLKTNETRELNVISDIINIEIINDEIYVLTNKELLIYDSNLNDKSIIMINNPINMIKTSNKLYIISKENDNDIISSYIFDYKINNIENKYGTTSVEETEIPGNIVEISAMPNSGYVVSDVIVTNQYNEPITLENNKFIMPEGNVDIEVKYEELISNPETKDVLVPLIIVGTISLLLIIKLYKKIKWIK